MKTLIKITLTFFSTLFLISGLIIHANGQAIVLISAFVPCANNGAGEIVEGVLTANSTIDPGERFPYQLTVTGQLYGSESGIAYQTIYVDLNHNYPFQPKGAGTATTVNRLQFVGGGAVFIMSVVFHFKAEGGDDPLLVEIEHTMEKCLTNELRN